MPAHTLTIVYHYFHPSQKKVGGYGSRGVRGEDRDKYPHDDERVRCAAAAYPEDGPVESDENTANQGRERPRGSRS
jgi:hypothetical protein